MSEFLTKEEIRQWRSSLEKITLEEYAARLGKVINEEKETRDIVDIVLEKETVLVHDSYRVRTEKINTIAQRAFAREKEITTVKHNLEKPIVKDTKSQKAPAKEVKTVKETKAPVEIKVETTKSSGVNVAFKKPLTEREQLVFNHFLENKGSIVYAKDLAELLDLPRDYVYKYIKNLRNKIVEDKLENANNGGYILNI